MRTARSSRTAPLFAGPIAAALLLAACGGTAQDEPTTATNPVEDIDDSPDVDPDEPAAQPAGEPVRIGLVNQERGAVSFPDFGNGARAAAHYINDQGGIGGQPLELVECLTDGSPESSSACGAEMVDADVEVVFNGIDLGNDPIHPILSDAGIVMVGPAAFTGGDFVSEAAFWLSAGQGGFSAGVARFLGEDLEAEVVVQLGQDLQFARDANDVFVAPVMEALGVEWVPIYIDASAPDFAVAVATALESDPDAIFGFFQEPDAARLAEAVNQSGFDGAFVNGALRSWITEASEAAREGVYTSSSLYDWDNIDAAPERSQPELRDFVDAMESHFPDQQIGLFTQTAFGSMVDLARILQELGPEAITAGEVKQAFRSKVDEPQFMGGSYSCDGAQLPGSPGTCASSILILEYVDGALTPSAGPLDGAALLAGGG